MKQTYKIAEKNIEIDSLFPEIHALCSDYVTNQIADFSVKISEQDIEFEREKSVRERIAEGLEIINYPDSYLETLAVYRKIADKMLSYDTMLFLTVRHIFLPQKAERENPLIPDCGARFSAAEP